MDIGLNGIADQSEDRGNETQPGPQPMSIVAQDSSELGFQTLGVTPSRPAPTSQAQAELPRDTSDPGAGISAVQSEANTRDLQRKPQGSNGRDTQMAIALPRTIQQNGSTQSNVPQIPAATATAQQSNNGIMQTPHVTNKPAQPSKSRRLMETQFGMTSHTALIDAHIHRSGGLQQLSVELDQPRFQLLRDACEMEDLFYIVLHQVFCCWTLNPEMFQAPEFRVLNCTLQSPSLAQAFKIVGTLIKDNDGMKLSHLKFFSGFPSPFLHLIMRSKQYLAMVRDVCEFLHRLATSWKDIAKMCRERIYPPLVDELIFHLNLLSPNLQQVVFTATRRNLGIADDEFGKQMERIFKRDKEGHENFAKRMNTAYPPTNQEVDQRNASLIENYSAVVEQWKRRNQTSGSIPNHASQGITQTGRRASALMQSVSPYTQQYTSPPSYASPIESPQQACIPQLPSSFNQGRQQKQHRVAISNGNGSHAQSPTTQTNFPKSYPPTTQTQHSTLAQNPTFNPLQQAFRPSGPGIQQGGWNAQNWSQHQSTMQNQGIASSAQYVRLQGQQTTQPPQYTSIYRSNQHLPVNGQVLPLQLQRLQYASQPTPQSPSLPRYQAPQYYAPQNTQSASPQQNMDMQFATHNAPMRPPTFATNLVHSQSGSGSALPNVPVLASTPAGQPYPQVVTNFTSPNSRSPVNAPAFTKEQFLVAKYNEQDPLQRQLIPPNGWTAPVQLPNPSMNAVHDATLRSPKLMLATTPDADPALRYYQTIRNFAVHPMVLSKTTSIAKLSFNVPDADKPPEDEKDVLPHNARALRKIGLDSSQYRIRCTALQTDTPNAYEWVTADSVWPQHIFIEVNKNVVSVRRKGQHGKDLPVDITPFVLPGVNHVEIASLSPGAGGSSQLYGIAVEIVEILEHQQVVNMVTAKSPMPRAQSQRIPAARSIEAICKALSGGLEDDDEDIAIVATELTIDLADPFMARIFDIPVRGSTCLHRECFDLQTFLDTRVGKKVPTTDGRLAAVCHIDIWKCPLCGKDARPYSLRVDEFLVEVRAKLAADGMLDCKAISVDKDGQWKPKIDDAATQRRSAQPDKDDDDGKESDEEMKITRKFEESTPRSQQASQAVPELIELDD